MDTNHAEGHEESSENNAAPAAFMQRKPPVKILNLPSPATMEVPECGTLILQHTLSQDVQGCTWTLDGRPLHNSARCKVILRSYAN